MNVENQSFSPLIPTKWTDSLSPAYIERKSKIGKPESYGVYIYNNCLSLDGEWEIEPSPSNRSKEWLENHRFSTFKEAAEALVNADFSEFDLERKLPSTDCNFITGKYVTLQSESGEVFSIVFGGVFNHKLICELDGLNSCNPIAAGFSRLRESGFEFDGYSRSLLIGHGEIDTLESQENIFSGVFANTGSIAFITDKPKLLSTLLNGELKDFTFTIKDGDHGSISSPFNETNDRINYSLTRFI